MDYLIMGQMAVRDGEDLLLLLEAQDTIRFNVNKSGTLSRFVYSDDKPDLIMLDLRTRNPNAAKDWFQAFRGYLETAEAPGWIAWHECRHEDKINGCSFNEVFINPAPEVI